MPELGEKLSEREIDVLKCVADGSSNKEVATHLSISPYTVKTHLRNIYTKLGAGSRTEAIRVGMERGVIVVPGQPANGETAVSPPAPTSQPDATPETVSPSEVVQEETAVVQPPVRRFNWQIASIIGLLLLLLIAGYLWLSDRTAPVVDAPVQYDIQDLGNKWSAVMVDALPRTHMATASVGLSVYQIGGQSENGVLNDVVVLNTLERTVGSGPAKPTAVSHASAAVLYGEIYVVGGIDGTGAPVGTVEAYSPTANGWRPIASLPTPTSGALTLAIQNANALFVFGGYDGETAVSTAYRYDLNADSWEALPDMPVARANAAGGFVNNEFYVVGGENESGTLTSCARFSLTEGSWSECPQMENARAHAEAVSFRSKLYVFGGTIVNGENQYIAEIYDPATAHWEAIESPNNLQEWTSWEGLGVSLVGSDIYATNGQVNGRYSTETYIYSPFANRVYLPATSSDN